VIERPDRARHGAGGGSRHGTDRHRASRAAGDGHQLLLPARQFKQRCPRPANEDLTRWVGRHPARQAREQGEADQSLDIRHEAGGAGLRHAQNGGGTMHAARFIQRHQQAQMTHFQGIDQGELRHHGPTYAIPRLVWELLGIVLVDYASSD
jgi:hypothetical protein